MFSELQKLVIETCSLYAVGMLFIGLRILAQVTSVGVKNFALDDYLMIMAAIVYTGEAAISTIAGVRFQGLANNGMTDEQRDNLDPYELQLRVSGSKSQIAGWLIYLTMLWLLKTCLLIFYSRLTRKIKIAGFYTGGTYIIAVLSICLGCRPFQKNWQVVPNPGAYCEPATTPINLGVVIALNISTDLILLSIPMPLIYRAKLNRGKKIFLVAIFSGGIFCIIAGILGVAVVFADPVDGASRAAAWGNRETTIAVVIGNVPMINPLFARIRIFGKRIFGKPSGAASPNHPHELEDLERQRPKKIIKSDTYVTGYTASQSTEQIIDTTTGNSSEGWSGENKATLGNAGGANGSSKLDNTKVDITSKVSSPPTRTEAGGGRFSHSAV